MPGSIANPQFSISVLGVTLAAEYALYTFLPIQSALIGLKYFNIFAYVHTATLYTQYLNVDLFGFAVGIRRLALWGIAVIGVLCAVWALLIQCKRRPEGSRAEQNGYEPWIVNDFSYDIVYGPQSVSKQRFNGSVAVLLTALGAEIFQWVSPLVPASAELLWGLGSGSLVYLLLWIAWLLVTLSARFVCYKKWVQ